MSLRSCGLRTADTPPHSRGGCRPGLASRVHPPEIRGRGEHRVLAAPAGLACKRKCTLRTQATTGQPEQPAFPARWSYGLYVVSSARRAVWPPSPCARHARLDLSVGRSGPHDFAVRPDAFVGAQARCTSRRPPHPASHVRDDRDTPLLEEAGRVERTTNLRKTEEVYFARSRLTSSEKWKCFARRAIRFAGWVSQRVRAKRGPMINSA